MKRKSKQLSRMRHKRQTPEIILIGESGVYSICEHELKIIMKGKEKMWNNWKERGGCLYEETEN